MCITSDFCLCARARVGLCVILRSLVRICMSLCVCGDVCVRARVPPCVQARLIGEHMRVCVCVRARLRMVVEYIMGSMRAHVDVGLRVSARVCVRVCACP